MRIYGIRSEDVLKLAEENAALRHVFDPETGTITAEIVFAVHHEMAEKLSDCLLRRTMVGLNSHAGLNAVDGAASEACTYLGWNNEENDAEVAAYRVCAQRFLPIEFSTATPPR